MLNYIFLRVKTALINILLPVKCRACGFYLFENSYFCNKCVRLHLSKKVVLDQRICKKCLSIVGKVCCDCENVIWISSIDISDIISWIDVDNFCEEKLSIDIENLFNKQVRCGFKYNRKKDQGINFIILYSR